MGRPMTPHRSFRVLDLDYPAALRALPSPPDPLCVRGELPPAPYGGVAIVGTREPTPDAARFARELAGTLARLGVVVWSGGALGIDAAAHEGALAAGGPTVVVTGTGLDHCFPPEHAALFDRVVASGGALVSPFAPEQPATTWTFLRRNPVLAALTRALVVVQAPLRSGARSAAAAARRLGRPLYVVPAAPWDTRGLGCLAEIERGATPLTRVPRLLEALGLSTPDAPAEGSGHAPAPAAGAPRSAALEAAIAALDPTARRVLDALGEHPAHVDELCVRTGLEARVVQQVILTLTLEAVLVEGSAGLYMPATR